MKYVELAIALLSVCMLVLAGCGGVQSSEGVIVSSGSNVGDDVLRIGYIGPLTGDPAVIGVPISQGMQLAVKEINEQGGVNGKLIEAFYEDGKCNGRDGVSAFLKLYDVNDVDAVVVMCSPEVMGVAPAAKEKGVLVISPSATAPPISHLGEHVYRVVPSDVKQGAFGAELIKTRGYEKVGILYINHDYGVGLSTVVSGVLGDKVIANEAFDPDTSDMRGQLTKMQDADVIYLAAFPRNGALAMTQMRELGITADVIASEGVKDEPFLEAGEGVTITYPAGEGNHYSRFASGFREAFGEEPGVFSAESYDSVFVLSEAWGTGKGLIEGMKDVVSYDGAAGDITFDEYGDADKPYDLFTVRGGEFVKLE